MMKKYLGSTISAYVAVICPLAVVGPLFFAIAALCSEISGATVFLSCMCCGCSVIWFVFIKKEALQLYAWGTFEQTCVRIHSPFTSEIILDYDKCKDMGIGCYTHGVLNSRIGSKIYFIYLSYDSFEEKYREKINLWKPNKRRIKVQFNIKLYEYLLSVLPKKQALMLQEDYNIFFSKK